MPGEIQDWTFWGRVQGEWVRVEGWTTGGPPGVLPLRTLFLTHWDRDCLGGACREGLKERVAGPKLMSVRRGTEKNLEQMGSGEYRVLRFWFSSGILILVLVARNTELAGHWQAGLEGWATWNKNPGKIVTDPSCSSGFFKSGVLTRWFCWNRYFATTHCRVEWGLEGKGSEGDVARLMSGTLAENWLGWELKGSQSSLLHSALLFAQRRCGLCTPSHGLICGTWKLWQQSRSSEVWVKLYSSPSTGGLSFLKNRRAIFQKEQFNLTNGRVHFAP